MGSCKQCLPNTSLLQNSPAKVINFKDDKLVINHGPNQLAKLDLCLLNIPYEQYVRTSITLPKNSNNIILPYCSSIGKEITFLTIVAIYDTNNKKLDCNYISYFFDTEPDVLRYMADIMILSGTEKKPLPQIFVNNPSKDYSVTLEIIASTTKIVSVDGNTNVASGVYTISNLRWTDILSDTLSKDLIVYSDSEPIAYLDVAKIVNIEKNGKILTLDDSAFGQINLTFLTDNDVKQAHSLIAWVLRDPLNNLITTSTQADTLAPVITYKDTFTTEIIFEDYASTSALTTVVTKDDIIELWIDSVVDNRDGEIAIDHTNISITAANSSVEINAITTIGKYHVVVTVSDLACNIRKDDFLLNVKDENPAKIIVKSNWVANYIEIGKAIGVDTNGTDGLNERIYLQDYPFNRISKQNLIDIFIDSVIDDLDGSYDLNINNITVTILSGISSLPHIESSGNYDITFSVTDLDNNTSSYLWKDINTELTNHLSVIQNSINVTISTNQVPTVVWYSPIIPINLYTYNVGGVITKTNLFNSYVLALNDDRTASNDLKVIVQTIVQTHVQDNSTSSGTSGGVNYVAVTENEVLSIAEGGIYTYQIQILDGDGAIGVDSISLTVFE